MSTVFRMLTAFIVSLLIYLVVHSVVFKKHHLNRCELLMAFYIADIAVLLILLLQPGYLYYGYGPLDVGIAESVREGIGINVVPFSSLYFVVQPTMRGVFNPIANLLLFVPIGFGLPLFWNRWNRISRMIPLAILAPCTVEIAQLFLGRTVETDDGILNGSGSSGNGCYGEE